MKTILKTSLLLCIMCSMALAAISANPSKKRKANKETTQWRYDIVAEQVGSQGSYLLKVWSYSKKPYVAAEQSKKNAVHGVIFKGFAGEPGVPGKKAMVTDPDLERKQAAYFKDFFSDGGAYMRYVDFAGDRDRVKIGKEYKVGVVVSVNAAALRKHLEADGMIPALGAGF